MATYSIKDLELLTGIKAHTIRMWERRYGIVEPARTMTNIRNYSDDHLKKLLSISILNSCGMKISMLAKLNLEELSKTVSEVLEKHKSPGLLTDQLIVAMVNFDERKCNDLLNGSIAANGFGYTIEKVIFPFLDKLGIMWQTNKIMPAHEHFATGLIRKKIFYETELLGPNKDNSPQIIYFLPEEEYHEIVLLALNYFGRSKGFSTLYLGQSVPTEDVITIGKQLKPKMYVMSSTFPQPPRLEHLLKELSSNFPLATIIGGGPALDEVKRKPKNFAKLTSFVDFQKAITI